MKKIYLIFLVGIIPFITLAQGKIIQTKDPLVAQMESSRKTAAPFSVLFRENSNINAENASRLFTAYLNVRPGTDELRMKQHDVSKDNISIDRYQQYFKGIKVEQGQYVVISKNGKVSFMNGDFFAVDAATSVTPSISKDAAKAKAIAYIPGGVLADDSYAGELVFIEDMLHADAPTGKVYLAYKFLIGSSSKTMTMKDVYVDAATGEVLFYNSQVMSGCFKRNETKQPALKNIKAAFASAQKTNNPVTVLSPSVVAPLAATIYSGNVTNMVTSQVAGLYRLETAVATEGYPTHTRNINHALVSGFTLVSQYTAAMAAAAEVTDLDNNWTAAEFANANKDNTALDVHWGSQRVYDYWNTRHGRLSWNGSNGIINCFVHGDVNWDNAFWQGGGGINSMFYGDGSNVATGFSTLSALDVTGHEIGHGVCQATANLTYSKESGGMNEGFSDIWGASIEHFGDPHETDVVAKRYFDVGEEIGLPYPSNPLRSMNSPKKFGQPNTYLGTYWVSTTTSTDVGGDNWGVHTNSGVLNYWFYLLVSGGSGTNDLGNAYAVAALDWVKTERIAFLTEQSLTASSNYAAARTASISVATTLYGACSAEVEAVTKAWYAVGVGTDYTPCVPQIGFKNYAVSVSEFSGVYTCPSSKVITVPMMVIPGSPALAGGDATVTVTATGTATSGKDYTIGTGTATFAAGSTADQNVTITILDDGDAEGTETIRLDFSITANGSNVTKSDTYKQVTVSIADDETSPEDGNSIVNSGYLGFYNITASSSSPFKGASAAARSQFMWTPAELTAAGLKPKGAIKSVSFAVVVKSSSQPFTGYTISFANTLQASMSGGYVTAGLTPAYTGNYSSVLGDNTIALTTPFTWDGTSNLVMQVCFTNAAGSGTDQVAGYTISSPSYAGYTTSTTNGCGLTGISTSTTRPLVAFSQQLAPATVESGASSNRTAQLYSGSNGYFYSSADNELIAAVTAPDKDLGCVTANITAAGTGFATLTGFPGAQRSLKEVTITPTTNGSTAKYNATIFYTDAELAGKTPSSLFLLKTNAATDAGINTGNSVLVSPTIVSGTNYKGFRGSFTGFSRFFLVDNAFIVVPLNGLTAEAYLQNSNAIVKWKTRQENNSAYFSIERSYNGVDFTEIRQVTAAGNSSIEKQYSITDADAVKDINYYRIKLINANGSMLLSPIVSVKLAVKGAGITVMPNPVHDVFALQYYSMGKSTITILDGTGRKMKQFVPSGTSGTVSVDATGFAPGVYMIMLTDDRNNIITQKLIKN